MNTEDLLRRALSITAFALALTLPTQAQSNIPTQGSLIIQVQGLTAAKRDLIKQDLDGHGDLLMRYACVPAGILILETAPGRSVSDLKAQVAPFIQRHVPVGRSTELFITIQQAEDRCAQVR